MQYQLYFESRAATQNTQCLQDVSESTKKSGEGRARGGKGLARGTCVDWLGRRDWS